MEMRGEVSEREKGTEEKEEESRDKQRGRQREDITEMRTLWCPKAAVYRSCSLSEGTCFRVKDTLFKI